MKDMIQIINSYEAGIRLLQERIDQLTGQIVLAERKQEPQNLQRLRTRRYLLYTEIWDMERSIRSMKEYARPCAELRTDPGPRCAESKKTG